VHGVITTKSFTKDDRGGIEVIFYSEKELKKKKEMRQLLFGGTVDAFTVSRRKVRKNRKETGNDPSLLLLYKGKEEANDSPPLKKSLK